MKGQPAAHDARHAHIADAVKVYGWQFEPDSKGNLWLRVIDGRAAICFPPGTHITHNGGGNMTQSQTGMSTRDAPPSG
jgi:hypothetical protein